MAPEGDPAVRAVPLAGRGMETMTAAALGSARGRWTLVVRADETVHASNPRTLARYLRHETALAFFLPMNGQLPLLRVLPTAAGRLWGDDPLPAQALLEADPTQRLLTCEGIALAPAPDRAWPRRPTRPGDAWRRAERALDAGRPGSAGRALAALPSEAREGAGAQLLLGEAAFWRERWSQAGRAFRRAREQSDNAFAPTARLAGLGLGRVREAQGDLEEARSAYRAVLGAMPLDVAALSRLLAVDWRLGASWPESVGRLVEEHPHAWRGIGRALDRVVGAPAQLRALRSMPMSYGRDLFMARAALAAGDLSLARRSLARVEHDDRPSALGYQVWLTELAGGSAAETRAAAARAADLPPSARLALLLASTSVLGESAELPLLRPDEALRVGQWLLVVLADLCLLGLGAQARSIARLVASVLGSAGSAQARAVMWRARQGAAHPARPRPSRVRPARAIVLAASASAHGGPPWLSRAAALGPEEVR